MVTKKFVNRPIMIEEEDEKEKIMVKRQKTEVFLYGFRNVAVFFLCYPIYSVLPKCLDFSCSCYDC
jgi:hypothetical protein